MLLFWCSWFEYRFIQLNLVTVGKFCFHFSRVRDSLVDCINVSPSTHVELNHGLCDAQNLCALTKVGTVLKYNILSYKLVGLCKNKNKNKIHITVYVNIT